MTKLVLSVLFSAAFLLLGAWILAPSGAPTVPRVGGDAPFLILTLLVGLLTLIFMLGFRGERHRMKDFLLTSLLCKWFGGKDTRNE